ncbi:MAG: hypothetical protein AB7T07_11515 [Steroidobacteraceae bacterium]
MKKVDAPLDPAGMTAMLRDGVLAIGPEDIGLNPTDCPQVWGVMMELGEADVVVSLAALVDGSVSIYLSDGAGVIGCGLHPDVRLAAIKMLHVAEQAAGLCTPATEHPMPGANQVCFHLLTTHGILTGEASRAELDDGEAELAELYYAGHGVIGLVELLGAGVDLIDEMRLAQAGAQSGSQTGQESAGNQEFKARGRGCRILPYVGNVVRRSQN